MTLSPILYEVYRLAKKGRTTKAIAEEMDCTYRTVNHYLCCIYKKIGVNSKAEMLDVPIYLVKIHDGRTER